MLRHTLIPPRARPLFLFLCAQEDLFCGSYFLTAVLLKNATSARATCGGIACGCLCPVSSVGEKRPRACDVPVGLLLVGLFSHLPLFPLVLSMFAGEEVPVQGNLLG